VYADFQGNTIASTYKEQIKFDCTAVQLRGSRRRSAARTC
jgi:hypothetical protein